MWVNPFESPRYAIAYDNPHTGERALEMLNVIAGDFSRACEALKAQGASIIWSGFMSDFGSYGRAAIRTSLKVPRR